MDPIVEHIQNAVEALAVGHTAKSERVLRTIDFSSLVQRRATAYSQVWGPGGLAAGFKLPVSEARRTAARRVDIRATFSRDHYTCRYSHCRRQTVSTDVFRLLSTAFPNILPYHRNWRPLDRHILYWIYSTSLEHLIPFRSGGTSAAENLLTACYECNDIKNYLPIERLEWQVTEPASSEWNGLIEYIPRLRSAIERLSQASQVPAGSGAV
jgi:5-methylcytosine-specific restriction endonuclease McrA